MNHSDFPKNIRGLTLIELLVAIFIITLLASVTLIGIHGVRTKATTVAQLKTINEYYWAFKLAYKENGVLPWDPDPVFEAATVMCLASSDCNNPTPYTHSEVVKTKLAQYVNLGPPFPVFMRMRGGSPDGLAESPVYKCHDKDSIADGGLNQATIGDSCSRGYIEYYLEGENVTCLLGGGAWYVETDRFDNGVQCKIEFPGLPDGCDHHVC